MKELRVKKCRFPGCRKEVHTEAAMFCGDHERKIRESGKKVIGAAGAAVGLVLIATRTLQNLGKKKS